MTARRLEHEAQALAVPRSIPPSIHDLKQTPLKGFPITAGPASGEEQPTPSLAVLCDAAGVVLSLLAGSLCYYGEDPPPFLYI